MESLTNLAIVVVVVGALVLLLKWTWGRGHSLVARRPAPGPPGAYGLLVAVAEPRTDEEARRIAARLEEAGIRHTVATTTSGTRVMVWREDAARSLVLLSRDPEAEAE